MGGRAKGKHTPEHRARKFEEDRQKRMKEDEETRKRLNSLRDMLPPRDRGKK